jgi:hypothetical protein
MAALAATPVTLGAVADLPALADAARAQLAGGPAATAPAGGATTTAPLPPDPATQACLTGGQQAATDAGQEVVLVGTATLDGRPVAVVVTQAPDGHRVLTASDPAAECGVVGTTPL